MVYRPKVVRDLCFVLIPFEPPYLDYYEGIIKPAAKSVGLEAQKSDEIYGTGSIIHDIWRRIWESAVVVADVTGKNPNVNYELGLCHSLGVPTVLITQNIEDVPFDYRHRRCITYDTTKLKWEENVRQAIALTIQKVLSGEDRGEELRWPYDTDLLRETKKVGSFDSSEDATDVVIEGAALVAGPIAAALGPHGTQLWQRISKSDEIAVRSGVAIAYATKTDDNRRMAGVTRMQRVAADIRDSVGDGSKLAVLLCQEMLEAGRRAVKEGNLVRDVVYGMDAAVERSLEHLTRTSKAMSGDDIVSVARTAAGGDENIAGMVVQGFRRIGKDGLMYVQEWAGETVQMEIQEGMYFDRGFLTPDFVTDEKHQKAELHKPFVLVCDYKISSMRSLLPLLEQVAATKRDLLLIADDIEGEALATLVVNKRKGTLLCVPVKAPGYADRRRAILEDIAILTGGTLLSRASGYSLDNIQASQLGQASEVIVTKDGTLIRGGNGSKDAIEARAESIRNQIDEATDDATREKLMERLANLVGGVAVIKVGGINRQEIIDTKYKVTSAMHSARAAVEEGIVIGGGQVLFNIGEALRTSEAGAPPNVVGRNVVASALEKPLRQQIENARRDPQAVIDKIRDSKSATVGFNASTRQVDDLLSTGVVDATKIIRQSIRVAFAHARVILQTGAWAFETEGAEPPSGAVPLGDI